MYRVKEKIVGDEVIELLEGHRLTDYYKLLPFTLREMGRHCRVLGGEGI